jgi:hypothetical protein
MQSSHTPSSSTAVKLVHDAATGPPVAFIPDGRARPEHVNGASFSCHCSRCKLSQTKQLNFALRPIFGLQSHTPNIDDQMGGAKRAARGTARFGPAQARPGPHKDGSGRHGPLWRVMLGPLPRHVGRHGTARLSEWHDLARYIFPYTLKFVTFVIV